MKFPSLSSYFNIELNTPKSNDKNAKNKDSVNKKNQAEDVKKKVYKPREIYLQWKAPDREKVSFTNKKLSRSMIIIALFFGTLFIVMQEYVLILAISSIIFVYYAISKSPEQIVEHEINSDGLLYGGEQYDWEKLESFFFKNENLLCIETYLVLPRRLFLVVDEKNKKDIKDLLEKQIPFILEPEKSSIDKVYEAVMNSLNK